MRTFRGAVVTTLAILWVVPCALLIFDVGIIALGWPDKPKTAPQYVRAERGSYATTVAIVGSVALTVLVILSVVFMDIGRG
jgi:hypothetical protein